MGRNVEINSGRTIVAGSEIHYLLAGASNRRAVVLLHG